MLYKQPRSLLHSYVDDVVGAVVEELKKQQVLGPIYWYKKYVARA